MSKFKFKVTKTFGNGETIEFEVTTEANEKLDALGNIKRVYPPYDGYECEFIGIV